MVRLARVMGLLLLIAPAAWAQSPPADQAVNWDFADGQLAGWRCKTNTQMQVAAGEAQHPHTLAGRIAYGEFSFGWFTRSMPATDFTGIWAVELDVRADGQGGQLIIQLGRTDAGPPIYYANRTGALKLDFTGWRHVRFLLPGFVTPPGRSRREDLARIHFLELFVDGGRKTGATDIAFTHIRAVRATGEQAEALRQFEAEAGKLAGPPAVDGANLLPNPSFESDLTGAGTPDFWAAAGPQAAQTNGHDSTRAHAGQRSVFVDTAPGRRGAWQLRVPLAAGPWRFSAWYAGTAGGKLPEKAQARITLLSKDGGSLVVHHLAASSAHGAWQQGELKFEAPAATAAALVQLTGFPTDGKIWWDDIHLGADVTRMAEIGREQQANAAALQEARKMMPAAQEAVKQLKQRAGGGEDWPLLLAVLDWALEDAQLALEAGLGTSAQATLTDVVNTCARADEIVATAAQQPHPAPSRPDADGNPYCPTLSAAAAALARDKTVYHKGEAGYQQIENAWTFRTLGENSAVIAWGLLQPRSESYHSPALLRRLLTLFQAITENHDHGDFNIGRTAIYGADPNINRFCLEPMMDALLLLEAEYPWTILPSKREEWRRELRTLVDFQYQTYGPREPLEPERPRYYPNMDVHHLLIMEWAYRLFGDEKYQEDRDTMLAWLEAALYPGGAWTYVWPQNECYVYHQLNVSFLARYYEVTHDERARRILRKSAGYYPLVHDREGMTESYTDCSWKHYWTAAAPIGADIIAGMFDDADNKAAAVDASRRGWGGGLAAIYAAPWWKDIKPAPRRDDYILLDRSVEGPRGQFGKFSFAGTARVTPPGEIGKDTFVGCMVGDREAKSLPLDAALQVATVEARLKPDGNHWQNARYCSGHEQPSVIVAPDFATLCVRYGVTAPAWGHGSSDEAWEGIQEWFLCRDRLLGLLTIRALADTQCAGVWGRLRFGMHQEIEAGENGLYRYGSLIAKVHDHNFARLETAKSETFFLDKPEAFRSRELLLKDQPTDATGPFHYQAGQEFHFVAEVLPYWSDLARDVAPVREGTLRGFAFTQGGQRTLLLHNDGDKRMTRDVTAQGKSVQVFTPSGPPKTVALAQGQARVTIAAGSQVVVVMRP